MNRYTVEAIPKTTGVYKVRRSYDSLPGHLRGLMPDKDEATVYRYDQTTPTWWLCERCDLPYVPKRSSRAPCDHIRAVMAKEKA